MTPAMPPIPVQRAPLPGAAWGGVSVSRYGDIDEQAAALTGWHQRYLQLSRGRFDGTVQRLQLDGVGLFIEDLHQSVHQTGWVRPDVFAIGVPLAVEGDARFCGLAASADTLHVFSGRSGFEFRSPQRHVMIGIEMDRPLYEAHVAPAAGEHAAAGLHHADPAVLGELRGFLVDLFQSAGPVAEGQGEGHAPLRKQVRTQLLDRIALAMAPREAAPAERHRIRRQPPRRPALGGRAVRGAGREPAHAAERVSGLLGHGPAGLAHDAAAQRRAPPPQKRGLRHRRRHRVRFLALRPLRGRLPGPVRRVPLTHAAPAPAQRRALTARAQDRRSVGGVVTTWPSFTGSVLPGLNDVRTVPSRPSNR